MFRFFNVRFWLESSYYWQIVDIVKMTSVKNVLGEELKVCCKSPMTGFYRTGKCETGPQDMGVHIVCAEVTAKFLKFSKERGNDLSTPVSMYGFPGLKPGDCWCLCAARWKEALEAGFAPPINLAATHEAMLEYFPLEVLKEHSVDLIQGDA